MNAILKAVGPRIQGVAWRVYEVREKHRERLEDDLAADLVSRTSIWLRDARHFGWDRASWFAVLEGPENVLQDADDAILRYGRVPGTADSIYKRVKWEDDASAAGLGVVMAQLPEAKFKKEAVEATREVVKEVRSATRTLTARLRDKWRARKRR